MAERQIPEGGKAPSPEDQAAMQQLLKWAMPIFDVMLDQAMNAMGANAGGSAIMYAHCLGASMLALQTKAKDPKAALMAQLDLAWERAVKLAAKDVDGNG